MVVTQPYLHHVVHTLLNEIGNEAPTIQQIIGYRWPLLQLYLFFHHLAAIDSKMVENKYKFKRLITLCQEDVLEIGLPQILGWMRRDLREAAEIIDGH